jgi:hypothetical protein
MDPYKNRETSSNFKTFNENFNKPIPKTTLSRKSA